MIVNNYCIKRKNVYEVSLCPSFKTYSVTHSSGYRLSPLVSHVTAVAWIRPELVCDDAIIQRCEEVLCDAESVRYRRFLRQTDRHRFLVAHALKRRWLGTVLDLPPKSLEFEIDHLGKPFLVSDARQQVAFNLSHTTGMVACAISRKDTVGIDVEDCSRAINVEIGRSVYSEAEMAELRALPVNAQRDRFFQLWTLKEAYSKARGLGFQLPMKQCEFRFAGDQSYQPVFGPDVRDVPDRWHFESRLMPPDHRCALAVPVGDADSNHVEFHEFTERDLCFESD